MREERSGESIMLDYVGNLREIESRLPSFMEDNPQTGRFRVARDIFTDPELFELEMKHIWEGNWIYLAHESPAEKKSNDSKGLHSSPSAASRGSKADQRRLTVKALGSRGLPTLKLPNQRCQAQRFEIADFLFGRALNKQRFYDR